MKTRKFSAQGPKTLAFDVGGTGLKAAILDASGKMITKRLRVPTVYPCTPAALLKALCGLAEQLPGYDRVSIGFPGVVRGGVIVTAPHYGNDIWRGYPLEATLAMRLGKPARLLNDAEVQGLGIITGKGLEVVLTLGTGVGSAVFSEGKLAPHLELAHHPIHKSKTYNEYVGNEVLHKHGHRKWKRRVLRMIDIVDTLLNYDVLHIGGGNSTRLTGPLPDKVKLASNDTGLTGGIHLWDERVWKGIRGASRQKIGSASRRLRKAEVRERGVKRR